MTKLLQRASWPNGMGETYFPRGERDGWYVERAYSRSHPTRLVTKDMRTGFVFAVETAFVSASN